MTLTKCRIIKYILRINAINPCDTFKFEWDGSNLEVSSICRGTRTLKSRTYNIPFNNSEVDAIEDFLNTMCYTIDETRGYFMDLKSIPCDSVTNRVFKALFEISSFTPVFDYSIEKTTDQLIISNTDGTFFNSVTKVIRVPYTPHEYEEFEKLMKSLFKRSDKDSNNWYLHLEYLFTCM